MTFDDCDVSNAPSVRSLAAEYSMTPLRMLQVLELDLDSDVDEPLRPRVVDIYRAVLDSRGHLSSFGTLSVFTPAASQPGRPVPVARRL